MNRTHRMWWPVWFAGTLTVGGGYGHTVGTLLPDHPLTTVVLIAGGLGIGATGWTVYNRWRHKPAVRENDVLDRHRPSRNGSPVWDCTHLDGLSVRESAVPPRFHRCWIQTRETYNDDAVFDQCACGAVRTDDGPWTNKNLRRRQRRKQVSEL